MILYHYTSQHHIGKIRGQGLTRGMLPWRFDLKTGEPLVKRPFQWLTTSASWEQPWCLWGNLPFARNAWRVTVCIPRAEYGRVINWRELCASKHRPESADEINQWGGDWENWRLYHGKIPPAWFLEIARNPGQSHEIKPELDMGGSGR